MGIENAKTAPTHPVENSDWRSIATAVSAVERDVRRTDRLEVELRDAYRALSDAHAATRRAEADLAGQIAYDEAIIASLRSESRGYFYALIAVGIYAVGVILALGLLPW